MNNHRNLFAGIAGAAILAGFGFPSAFDNKAGWKLDAEGKIEMKDGNPIWINATGAETTIAGDQIGQLNNENRRFRERAEKAEEKLAAFKSADGKEFDAETARKAIDMVSKIDAKTLIDAGKVDEVRAEITRQFQTQIADKDKALGDLKTQYDGSRIANMFASSEFIKNNVAMPLDFFEAAFQRNFKISDKGEIHAFDRSGNPLYSKADPSKMATGDEAFELLVGMHPQKDTILRADGGGGSGNNGNGGERGSSRVMKRAEFDKLPPAQQSAMAAKAGTGEIQIVD